MPVALSNLGLINLYQVRLEKLPKICAGECPLPCEHMCFLTLVGHSVRILGSVSVPAPCQLRAEAVCDQGSPPLTAHCLGHAPVLAHDDHLQAGVRLEGWPQGVAGLSREQRRKLRMQPTSYLHASKRDHPAFSSPGPQGLGE